MATPIVTDQYVWGEAYANELVLRDSNADGNTSTGNLGISSSGLEQRIYAEHDANWNVTALTDTSGNVLEQFTYDPYGNVTVLSPSSGVAADLYSWVYLFQSGRRDATTGLYKFEQRDYNPALGTWMEQDPAGYINGLNRYQAFGDRPLSMVDPSGLCTNGGTGINGGQTYSASQQSGSWLDNFIDDLLDPTGYGSAGQVTESQAVQNTVTYSRDVAIGVAAVLTAGLAADAYAGYLGADAAATFVGSTEAGAVGGAAGNAVANVATQLGSDQPFSLTSLAEATMVGAATGGAAGAVANVLAEAFTGAAESTPQYVQNFANGKAFEQQGLNYLEGVQNDVAPQVSVRPYTDSGDLADYRVRLDAIGTDDAGNLNLTDFKSSDTAGFSPNQANGYPLLQNNGGQVVGNNGLPFYPPGTQIPPTPVNIIRPGDIP
jgi:RHS repeat-associated protein